MPAQVSEAVCLEFGGHCFENDDSYKVSGGVRVAGSERSASTVPLPERVPLAGRTFTGTERQMRFTDEEKAVGKRRFIPPTDSDIPMHGWAPYSDVHRERIRAHKKHDSPEQGHRSMERVEWDEFDQWLAVVGEEWGEVSRAYCEFLHGHITKAELKRQLRAEMIQVLAMSSAWVDAIDHTPDRPADEAPADTPWKEEPGHGYWEAGDLP